MNLTTLVDIFQAVVKHDLPNAMAHRVDGKWQNISAKEVERRTLNCAHQLKEWGFAKGDRAAIISENRPEWAIADFAVEWLGGVDVPIYPTLTADQVQYILRDSGSRIAFVSTLEQLRKVLSVAEHTYLEKIIVMETLDDDLLRDGVFSMSEIAGHPAKERVLQSPISPDDLATIIYTSGTTGTPKGVMLTHGNITSNIVASTNTFEWSNKQGFISFLPLSHITARHLDYVMLATGIGISYCSSFEELPKMLVEVRPANFVAVPRVYEKTRKEAERRASTGIKKMIFEWAREVGKAYRAQIMAGTVPSSFRWRLADALVFSKVRAGLGGRIECCISGGAPLGLETAEWFADIGIRIFEGYGLTETSPVIAINTAKAIKLGTVGKPLPNVECKIAEDGELMVRGPSVTRGYWNLPQETTNSFDNGWFKTGDIGSIDPEGFLSITDRKKDLLKTSGGKLIAPQPIENALKNDALVAQATVIGDKRKFIAVIIAPNFQLLEEWARANSIMSNSRTELIANQKVQQLYDNIVSSVNKKLAHFETLKKTVLVPDEFTIASGEITPSLKLKRRVVEKKYASLIDAVYADTH